MILMGLIRRGSSFMVFFSNKTFNGVRGIRFGESPKYARAPEKFVNLLSVFSVPFQAVLWGGVTLVYFEFEPIRFSYVPHLSNAQAQNVGNLVCGVSKA